MQLRVSSRNSRLFSRAFVGVVFSGAATVVSAQTTVTLNQPTTQVEAATVRGGSYAKKNVRSVLATRASSDLEYHRRAFLKFDTQNTIPAGRSITSALLTVTVKMGSEDASRLVGAYQVTTSWAESEITWTQRRINEAWRTGGGDLGSKIDDAAVSNKAGTKVTFDVTALVKEAVAGHLGTSRYTRIALVDLENSTSQSYREYYLPSDSDVGEPSGAEGDLRQHDRRAGAFPGRADQRQGASRPALEHLQERLGHRRQVQPESHCQLGGEGEPRHHLVQRN